MSSMIVWLLVAALSALPTQRDGSIAAAVGAASPGDTIRIGPGVYREHLIVDVPVVLIGEGRPVIDGGGVGTVVELRAPAVLAGFTIRGSGRFLDQEDAGVLVAADSCEVVDNRLEDVLFGIYLKESHGSRVSGNRVVGKDRPLGSRGDGIRLWASDGARVEGNVVHRTRDVVIYFSHGLLFRNNRVSEGRYGLHYMYSSDNLFEHNEFVRNDVAAFIMYSQDITLRRNVFAHASGSSGYGVGLKDADRIEVVENLLVQNQVGLYLDNSPSMTEGHNGIRDNVFAFNEIAVELLPSVRDNDFSGNVFTANLRPVSVSGGGTALANDWRGNHWDDATAWDADSDGVLDQPYRIDRLSDDLFARHASLRLYELSPAALALDALARFFPLLEPKPIVVDSAPRPLPERLERFSVGAPAGSGNGSRGSAGATWAAIVALGLAGVSLWGAFRWPL